jgi:hypothetical protein
MKKRRKTSRKKYASLIQTTEPKKYSLSVGTSKRNALSPCILKNGSPNSRTACAHAATQRLERNVPDRFIALKKLCIRYAHGKVRASPFPPLVQGEREDCAGWKFRGREVRHMHAVTGSAHLATICIRDYLV